MTFQGVDDYFAFKADLCFPRKEIHIRDETSRQEKSGKNVRTVPRLSFPIGFFWITGEEIGASFFIKVSEFDRPFIGAIKGAAVSDGFEVSLLFDLMITSTSAVFAATRARGVLPSRRRGQKLSIIIGPGRATELPLTGNFISAGQGLIHFSD